MTTRVSQYQKGKTNLDFTGARDSEWQWHQLGHMQVCTSLHTDNHASTPPLCFLQAGCPSCRPTNSVKALKAQAHRYSSHQTAWNNKGVKDVTSEMLVCSQIHDALICSTCCKGMLAVKLCSNKILQFWPEECWIVQDVPSATDPVFWWPLCAFIKYIYLLTYKMVIKQQQSMADSFLHHFHINPVYQVSALFYLSFKFC